MILRKSCPVRGLKMKMAPLMGLVVKLPSNVLWMVTRYTLVSSTNLRNKRNNTQSTNGGELYVGNKLMKIGTSERSAEKNEEGKQVIGDAS